MLPSPTCAVLIIGNEILSGRTDDANINYIARRMNDLGISLQEVRVVRDDESAIVAAVNELRAKYGYVFTTGGIGPTHDDITMYSIAKAFGVPVERNEQVMAKFKAEYGDKATDATMRMADYPQGAELIDNHMTVAPGAKIGNVFAFAGIPRIMQAMLEAVIPQLQRGEQIFTKSLDIMASEGRIGTPLEEIQNSYPEVEIGSYPFRTDSNNGTSIVVRGTNAEVVNSAFHEVEVMARNAGAVLA